MDVPAMQWSPPPAAVGIEAGAALLLIALALTAEDRAGVAAGLLAAALLGALAARDALVRPRLSAGQDGVCLASLPGRARRVPWAQVHAVRVDDRGRRGRVLEIDLGEELLVLGRHALGADPREVAAALATVPGSPPPERAGRR